MHEPGSNTAYIVGLTGGIGSGKSTVADMFARLGAEVIDADEISRSLVMQDSPLLKEIAGHFGPDIIAEDGLLDRKKLRQLIFTDKAAKQWLESLLHPLIRDEIKKRIANSQGSYVILVVPLLLESGAYDFVDRVLVVDIPESVQVARVKHRDNESLELIQKIIKSQMSRQERINRADDVLQNDSTRQELQEQVTQLHEHYLQEAYSRSAQD